MTVEGAVAIVAGAAAGSIALIGFGLDSAIEGLASVVIIWHFTGHRLFSHAAEQRAQRQLLGAVGLSAHSKRLAHDVAEVGLLLRDAGRREGGSRLGGPALLPPGTDWPSSGHERPLSFLAAIDLAELPPGNGRPVAGWWLFFADLGEDEDGEGFFEPERNNPGARARLLSVAAGVTPEPAAPLGDELGHRPVTFEPVLTLRAATTSPPRSGSTRTRSTPTRRRSTCSGTRSASRRGWVASTGSADT